MGAESKPPSSAIEAPRRGVRDRSRALWDSAGVERSVVVEAGGIDPTKAARAELQDATSLASLSLTTEALITKARERKKSVAPGQQGYDQGDYRAAARSTGTRRPKRSLRAGGVAPAAA